RRAALRAGHRFELGARQTGGHRGDDRRAQDRGAPRRLACTLSGDGQRRRSGNPTDVEDRHYEYDEENRLTRVSQGGSTVKTFAYDGDGVLRVLGGPSGSLRHYV